MDPTVAGWVVAIIGPIIVWFITSRPGQKSEATQRAAQFVVDTSFKIAEERLAEAESANLSLSEIQAEVNGLREEVMKLRVGLAACEAKHAAAELELAHLRQQLGYGNA